MAISCPSTVSVSVVRATGLLWTAMKLPVMPPITPMLAKSGPGIPRGEGWLYEPKWDGFRAIVFRDGDDLHIGSRNTTPLHRYFPEVVEALKQALEPRCVIDGEIV